jgi:hypothetical protein
MKIIDAEAADDFENVVQIPTTGRNDSKKLSASISLSPTFKKW